MQYLSGALPTVDNTRKRGSCDALQLEAARRRASIPLITTPNR